MRWNIGSPILDRMNTAVDFMILNMVYLICCIPVITIGPATAALYQVTLREVRKEHGYLVRSFFRHFRELFFQGIFTFLFFAALLWAGAYALVFWSAFDTLSGTVAFLLTLFLTVIILCALLYVFPLMARFQNRFLQTIENAFLFAVSNAGSSFLLLLIRILAAGLLYLFPVMKIFMMIAGFSLTAWLDSLILTRLFSPYETVS